MPLALSITLLAFPQFLPILRTWSPRGTHGCHVDTIFLTSINFIYHSWFSDGDFRHFLLQETVPHLQSN